MNCKVYPGTSYFFSPESNPLTLSPSGQWEEQVTLATPRMFIVSNRHDAWNFSKFTNYQEIHQRTEGDYGKPDLDGRKILFIVGGFTSNRSAIKSVLRNAAVKVGNAYTAIIAYEYPSGEGLYYGSARKLALFAADKFQGILNSFSQNTEINIAAHSMGVYLTLNALNAQIIPSIWNLFLLGSAERQESLNDCVGTGCTSYHQTLRNVASIYAFASCKDDTLPYHTFLTGQQTLGRPTHWTDTLSEKVTVIDATNVVNDHGGFLISDAVFKAINTLSQVCLAKNTYRLKENGGLVAQDQLVVCQQTIRQRVAPVTAPTISFLGEIKSSVDYIGRMLFQPI